MPYLILIILKLIIPIVGGWLAYWFFRQWTTEPDDPSRGGCAPVIVGVVVFFVLLGML